MAFLKKTITDKLRVVWFGQRRVQESVTLPKGTSSAQAEDFAARIDSLLTGDPISDVTAEWLAGLDDATHARLVYYRLAQPRQNQNPTTGR
jgi:hypothetical protein